MKKSNSHKNFISRWINNDLDESEKASYESSQEFKDYNKILEKVDQLRVPSLDVEQLESKFFNRIEGISPTNISANSDIDDTIQTLVTKDAESQEKTDIEDSKEYKSYQKIISTADRLTPPKPLDLDIMKSGVFGKIDFDQYNDKDQTDDITDETDLQNTVEDNNHRIAKWINDELEPLEKEKFEQTKEYRQYHRLLTKIDSIEPPKMDMEGLENKLMSEIDAKKASDSTVETKKGASKSKIIQIWAPIVSVAAVFLIGFFLFYNTDIEYKTGVGEKLSIILPDGSGVELNAKSSVTYDPENWASKRELSLSGEAFFKVMKGSSFIVETDQGIIEVIGTQFNVRSVDDFFEVSCHEGKVKVSPSISNKDIVLLEGEGYRVQGSEDYSWQFSEINPGWLSGETVCYALSLKEVISKLESQYDISVKLGSEIDSNQRYTGTFTNTNLEVALKTIFNAMDLKYRFLDDGTVLIENIPNNS